MLRKRSGYECSMWCFATVKAAPVFFRTNLAAYSSCLFFGWEKTRHTSNVSSLIKIKFNCSIMRGTISLHGNVRMTIEEYNHVAVKVESFDRLIDIAQPLYYTTKVFTIPCFGTILQLPQTNNTCLEMHSRFRCKSWLFTFNGCCEPKYMSSIGCPLGTSLWTLVLHWSKLHLYRKRGRFERLQLKGPKRFKNLPIHLADYSHFEQKIADIQIGLLLKTKCFLCKNLLFWAQQALGPITKAFIGLECYWNVFSERLFFVSTVSFENGTGTLSSSYEAWSLYLSNLWYSNYLNSISEKVQKILGLSCHMKMLHDQEICAQL